MKINYRTDKDKKSAACEKQKVGANLVPVPMIFILKIKQPPPSKKKWLTRAKVIIET